MELKRFFTANGDVAIDKLADNAAKNAKTYATSNNLQISDFSIQNVYKDGAETVVTIKVDYNFNKEMFKLIEASTLDEALSKIEILINEIGTNLYINSTNIQNVIKLDKYFLILKINYHEK